MTTGTRRLISAGSLVCLVVVVLACGVACSGQDPPRQYSDAELGLDDIVDDVMVAYMLPFAQHRTSEERNRDRPDPTAGSGHERERNKFEHTIQLIVLVADDNLPPDVATGMGVLRDAADEAMDECAADAGWPGVRVYDVSRELGERYEREFGLTLEVFLDLRHECSKYAAGYPTLDREYRDGLVAKRRAHYVAAEREWMAANPHLVVPVEHHEGDNHPVEEYWNRVCKKSDDFDQCLRDNL